MTVQIVRGDARRLPLADNTVDLVVTSPPYFALRSYTDAGEHYDGQIGSEATPTEWLDALIDVTRECVRVLKPSGSLFVNLGDKYGGDGKMSPNLPPHAGPKDHARKFGSVPPYGRPKSLLGLPWRYALACIDQLSLILRAEIIWAKPNGLPESVTDRVRRSHETWFHLVLQPRYYSAVDEIRESYNPASVVHAAKYGDLYDRKRGMPTGDVSDKSTLRRSDFNPLGKLPGSVWTIPSEPLTVPPDLGVDHFAAFPLEFPRRIIRGWCPAAVCSGCGEGRRPVVNKGDPLVVEQTNPKRLKTGQPGNGTVGFRYTPNGQVWNTWKALHPDTITGYVCACTPHTDHPGTGEPSPIASGTAVAGRHKTHSNIGQFTPVGPWREYHFDAWTPAPTTPGVVLDPFGGTGTTALAALALGRNAIHVDLSADYNRIAEWRTTDRDQLAKAMQVDRGDRAREADLFDMEPLFEGLG